MGGCPSGVPALQIKFSLSTSKGQRSTCRGGGILWRLPAQLVTEMTVKQRSTITTFVNNLMDFDISSTSKAFSNKLWGYGKPLKMSFFNEETA